MFPLFTISPKCIDQLCEVGSNKEDVLRVPGNHHDIKRLIEQLECAAPFNVEELLNPHTLMGFVKKVLKDEVLTPLVGKTVQDLAVVALKESSKDADAQV